MGAPINTLATNGFQYIAQLDDSRALSIGLRDSDCVPGPMPDIILNNMTFK